MKYKWLLFDADNTLLDFSTASKKAMWNALDKIGITCTDELYQNYQAINHKVWQEFELKTITAEELRTRRMSLFLQSIDQLNEDAFYFNSLYLSELVRVSSAYDYIPTILNELKKEGYLISIVTNGLKEVQRPRLRKVGLYDLFDSIVVSDEIGVAKPDVNFFEYTFKTFHKATSKKQTLMIGDNLDSDIRGGLDYGLTTCWISHSRENETTIIPDYTIDTLNDLLPLLSRISKS